VGGGAQRYPQRSVDDGRTWTALNTIEQIPGSGETGWGVRIFVARRTIVADYVDGDTFYMSNASLGRNPDIAGVWKSTDAGLTWTWQCNPWPSTGMYIVDLRAIPDNRGHLFATWGYQTNKSHPIAANTFMRSWNGGATWSAVPNVLEVNKFAFGKAYPGAPYLTLFIAGFVNGAYGIWMSTDAGDSWKQLISSSFGPWPMGLNDVVTAMEGDKDIVGRVYVGFGGNGAAYCDAA